MTLIERFHRITIDKSPPSLREDLYRLLIDATHIWDSRTLNALPNTMTDVETAIQANNNIGAVHQPQATRTVPWLYQNGKCIDHILPGRSTIPGAGHGAFAKRHLPAGTIITGSPLHHITMQRLFEMYAHDFDGKGRMYRTDQFLGFQLLINYCFTHPSTSLHLCPYGAGVNYINHNKTRANVKLQWADHGVTSHNATWLQMTPELMEGNVKVNLALDYVATKDIQQGDELFLDYGDEWENAWIAHSEHWEQEYVGHRWKNYISAFEYNQEHVNDPVRTDEEQKENPYPDNLQIRCHAGLWFNAKNSSEYEQLVWKGDNLGFPCRIFRRNDMDQTYGVIVIFRETEQVLRRSGVPRTAITFADLPYSTDMHLEGTFRHPLMLPDHLIPNAWRNVEKDRSL